MQTSLTDLVPLLQVAIGPVIMISGVGLLLLTMTNRLARVIDRSRQLAREDRAGDGSPLRTRQIQILYRRSRVVRRAIFLASVSLFLVALLIILLFIAALFRLNIVPLLIALFIASMLALIASLGAFIYDVHLNLVALDLELGFSGEDQDRS